MRGPPDLKCERAPLQGRPDRKIHVPSAENSTEPATDIQVRSLRQRFALADYFAASLAPLIWGVGPR